MKKNIYLSILASDSLKDYLKSKGFCLHLLNGSTSPVYREVSTHADIHMCRMGVWEKQEIFPGNTESLGNKYPENIIYNAVCTGKYFIHNLKYTDPNLMRAAEKWHASCFSGSSLQKLHTNQGYTRCCCLPVDDSSFITSDEGIFGTLSAAGAQVLLISKGHIRLPGFDYGFIGGCGGHIIIEGIPTMIFNGNLSEHPDFKNMADFIKARHIDIVYFEDEPLTDIGSILSC